MQVFWYGFPIWSQSNRTVLDFQPRYKFSFSSTSPSWHLGTNHFCNPTCWRVMYKPSLARVPPCKIGSASLVELCQDNETNDGLFNQRISAVRVSVEWMFGTITNYKFMDFKTSWKLVLLAKCTWCVESYRMPIHVWMVTLSQNIFTLTLQILRTLSGE